MSIEDHVMYFIVQDVDQARFYQHDLLRNETELITNFDGIFHGQRLLCLYSKCFWMERGKLMLYDVKGQSQSQWMTVPHDTLDITYSKKTDTINAAAIVIIPTTPTFVTLNKNLSLN